MDLCELENAPEMQKCPKTSVHRGTFLMSELAGWTIVGVVILTMK